MCVVSMIGDHYGDDWRPKPWKDARPNWPNIPVWPQPKVSPRYAPSVPAITREEFEDLKKQVAEMVKLLKRAKQYDKDNNEPDCEVEDKMALLRKVAKLVGVDLDAELAK